MRRNQLFIMLLLLGLLLAACTTPATEAPAAPATAAPAPATDTPAPATIEPATELHLYNWTEYIDPEIYELFFAETGITVIEDNFASNEEMLAKLQGGVTGYDLVVPSDYTIAIMIAEGMLAEINRSNVPNLSNLSPEFTTVYFDPGNRYSVPYQWGTTGIGYNINEVDEPTSWAIIFDPEQASQYAGRISMLDDPRESLAIALIYLGYDINTQNLDELEQAKDLLIEAKVNLQSYDSEQFNDLLVAEETVIAHGWNGDILVSQDEVDFVGFTIPKEGGVKWIDNIAIPVTVTPEGKLAAEMFINFILRPEIGALLSEWNYYASPNAASSELLSEEFLNNPAIYPPPEVFARLQFIRSGGDFDSNYQRIWDEVKSAP